ncbi:MAG TPA: GAF domain-containing protein, partial [Candidatus Nanopelagicaceae bacterium]
MTADGSSLPEVNNVALQKPEIKFSFSEEFQLAQFGQWPRVIKDLFHLENGLIKLINSEGKWIANEDGSTHIEDNDGAQVSDFALRADGVVCIADTENDPRILNGTMHNARAELRSYIGLALKAYDGSRVGVLCGWGKEPRIFSAEEVAVFEEIVKGVESQALNTLELYRAASIQRGMLPQDEIGISGYEMAGFCQPHLSAGGDFYDW